LSTDRTWRRCSACKDPIALGAIHYVCSVSTCNQKRTGLAFCSVSCWEVHLPEARHREAWALEKTAPSTREAETATPPRERPRRRIVPSAPAPAREARAEAEPPREVLIVASRLKEYIRASSGMKTSDRVLEPLSEIIREVCEQAIRNARRDERQTVLDRDIPRR
jgi:hypothetical protein